MTDNLRRSMSLFASLASATAIAYVADYAAHFEWHFSRVVVRRDALVAAVLLGVVVEEVLCDELYGLLGLFFGELG